MAPRRPRDRPGEGASPSQWQLDRTPDGRDGLTRIERAILVALDEARRELGREEVPTALLYGRVVEKVDVGQREFMLTLQRMVGRRG